MTRLWGEAAAIACSLGLTACDELIGLDDYETVESASKTASATVATGTGGAGAAPSTGGEGGEPGYAEVILQDAPMGYWRLGEPAGRSIALDATSFGRDGSYDSVTLEQAALIDDPFDAAAGFEDGSAVVMTADFHFAPKQSFTAELWFRPNTLDPMFRLLVGQRLAPNGELGWSIGMYGGTLRLRRASQPDDMTWDSSVAIPDALTVGNTYFIAGSFDSRSGDLCLDVRPGQRACVSSTFALTQAPIELSLWRDGAGSSGIIDELVIYNDVLPTERIDLHHSAGLGR